MTDAGTAGPLRRRRLLQVAGAGVSGLALGGTTAGRGRDSRASLTLENQESNGDSFAVASVSTEVEADLYIIEDAFGQDSFFGETHLPAGTDREGFTVELRTPIERTQTVVGFIMADDTVIAKDRCYVAVGESLDEIGVRFIEADRDSGFNYPYYLFVPSTSGFDDAPVLVQPNNTGTATDDFEKHRKRAELVVEKGTARQLSERLNVPLVVPVFPRPRSEPVDSSHYVHQLDRDTLAIDDGDLERVDRQLLRMVDDATRRLSDSGRSFSGQLMLNGFSASGNFVDRFTVLHPDRVSSVTAGGLNGMAILPLEEAKDRTLNYHVGIADVEELTGDPVDLEALDEELQAATDEPLDLPETEAASSNEQTGPTQSRVRE